MNLVKKLRYRKIKVPIKASKQWYQSALQFWQKTSSDENGVMMGRADLHPLDIQFSKDFLDYVCSRRKPFRNQSVLDCGAGIGRVSSHLLKQYFSEIDLLQKSQNLLEQAKKRCCQKVYRSFFCSGLQNFTFDHQYDAIWVQWVFTHLQNQDIKEFLQRAKSNLKQGGVIIVKQNFTTEQQFIDTEDCTIVRTNLGWKTLFYESKCLIFYSEEQRSWPQNLYPVKMWALI